jgi:hypothetical protein
MQLIPNGEHRIMRIFVNTIKEFALLIFPVFFSIFFGRTSHIIPEQSPILKEGT